MLTAVETSEEPSSKKRKVNRSFRQSDYRNLIQAIRLQDSETFFNHTRMTVDLFDRLLNLIGPKIKKRSKRPSIPEAVRLACTLRFLAVGDSLQTLGNVYGMSKSIICGIIKETCTSLWEVLQPIYLSKPKTEEWLEIAEGFNKRCNFPNCVGAIDAKHVVSTSTDNNSNIVVLFAVCDSNYKFTYIEFANFGPNCEGGIFKDSEFGKKLANDGLGLPKLSFLPQSDISFPYYFVGDEAFPLQRNLIRTYSKPLDNSSQIFNKRLNCARRCIENALGILVARWKILHKPISPKSCTGHSIIKAAICLHNFIKANDITNKYCNGSFVDRDVAATGEILPGQWRNEAASFTAALEPLNGLRRLGARNATHDAIALRNRLSGYINGDIVSPSLQPEISFNMSEILQNNSEITIKEEDNVELNDETFVDSKEDGISTQGNYGSEDLKILDDVELFQSSSPVEVVSLQSDETILTRIKEEETIVIEEEEEDTREKVVNCLENGAKKPEVTLVKQDGNDVYDSFAEFVANSIRKMPNMDQRQKTMLDIHKVLFTNHNL